MYWDFDVPQTQTTFSAQKSHLPTQNGPLKIKITATFLFQITSVPWLCWPSQGTNPWLLYCDKHSCSQTKGHKRTWMISNWDTAFTPNMYGIFYCSRLFVSSSIWKYQTLAANRNVVLHGISKCPSFHFRTSVCWVSFSRLILDRSMVVTSRDCVFTCRNEWLNSSNGPDTLVGTCISQTNWKRNFEVEKPIWFRDSIVLIELTR